MYCMEEITNKNGTGLTALRKFADDRRDYRR